MRSRRFRRRHGPWLLLVTSTWLGCGSHDGATSDAAIGQDAAGDAGPTLLGDCDQPEGPVLGGARIVLEGRFTCAPPGAPSATIVRDAGAWSTTRTSLEACMDASAAAVDFETEYVVVLGHAAFNTCGITLDRVVAIDGDAGPWVAAELTDSSAGCESACASGGAFVVAVALPRGAGETPTLCRRINPGCP